MSDKMTTAWWSLRIAFFLGLLLAGLDKFFYRLTNWDQYLSPMAQRGLAGHGHQFLWVAGVVEVLIALMVITSWTRLGAYLASLWLLLNAINLGLRLPLPFCSIIRWTGASVHAPLAFNRRAIARSSTCLCDCAPRGLR